MSNANNNMLSLVSGVHQFFLGIPHLEVSCERLTEEGPCIGSRMLVPPGKPAGMQIGMAN